VGARAGSARLTGCYPRRGGLRRQCAAGPRRGPARRVPPVHGEEGDRPGCSTGETRRAEGAMAARPDPGRSTVDTGAGPPPAGLAFASPQGRWTLLATVLGSGIAFLDSTVVTVALPRIGADLDAGVSGLQWVLNGYLAALSALILLGGSLGDRFGRRRVFVAGVVLFTAASV